MEYIDKSPRLALLNYVKGQVLYRLGVTRHRSGSTSYAFAVEEAAEYVRRVVRDYAHFGAGDDARRIEGKRILEIGPGDNLGVGLMLLAMGAESVTCLDGFAPRSDAEKNRQLYASLYRSMTPEERRRVADVVREDADGGVSLTGRRLAAHYCAPIEKPHPALEPKTYDIILSRAVLEHLADIRKGWAAMVRVLKPDGEMWHKVDFRCHKLFSRIHPLYFLTVDEKWWRLASSPDPTLNRARLPVYRELTSREFVHTETYFTHVLEDHEIEPHTTTLIAGEHYSDHQKQLVRQIRPLLKHPFSTYTDEELLVSGAFVISRHKRSPAQRPAAAALKTEAAR